jgi:formate hydrogenlyase subunit 4
VADVFYSILCVFGLAFYGIFLGLVFSGVDRMVVARMQSRIGPPLFQPFFDVLKLLNKQDMLPANAVPGIFRMAPVVALAAAVTLLFYLPLGGIGAPVLEGRGDAILALYLLLIPGLAMVIGGFAGGSPYAAIGAQREMVTMISYELPLATVILTFAWKLASLGVAQPFSLGVMAAQPIWGYVGLLGSLGVVILFFVMLLVTPGELGRIPFDSPEAETELAGGILVEYSGRSLALFQLAMAVKTVAMGALMVTLFLPWNVSGWIALPAPVGAVADFLFFLVKVGFLLFFSVSVLRAAMARLRISDVVTGYWKWIGSAAVVGLLLILLDAKG